MRVRELDGSAVLKNSNGDTWVGVAGGDVRINAANGSISVDLAQASVVAKSANGDVRLGEVVRGSVVLETRLGDLEVGIREGTAAWLDVSAKFGTRPQHAGRRRRPRAVDRDRRGARAHVRRRDRDPTCRDGGSRAGDLHAGDLWRSRQIVVSRPFSRAGTRRSRQSFAPLEPEERWNYHGTHGSG